MQRANSWLAIKITRGIGTMWAAYAFAAFDILALPTAIRGGLYGIVQWVASFFLQLVLLSIIMVGQQQAADASDARSAKTFEDAEEIKALAVTSADLLDPRTAGGLGEVMAEIGHLRDDLGQFVRTVNRGLGGGKPDGGP